MHVRWEDSFALSVGLLFATLSWPLLLTAQDTVSRSGDAIAAIDIDLDPRMLTLEVTVWDSTGSLAEIDRAIAAALPCAAPKQQSRSSPQEPSQFSRVCANWTASSLQFDFRALKVALEEAGVFEVAVRTYPRRGFSYAADPPITTTDRSRIVFHDLVSDLPGRWQIGVSPSPLSRSLAGKLFLGLFGPAIGAWLLGLLALRGSAKLQSRWRGIVDSRWLPWASWIIWTFVVESSGLSDVAEFLVSSSVDSAPLSRIAGVLPNFWPVPFMMAAQTALCWPVQKRLDPLSPWTRSEKLWTSFWENAKVFAPIPFVFIFLFNLDSFSLREIVQVVMLGGVVWFLIGRGLNAAADWAPYAVSDGQLPARARELASRIGAPLKRLLIIPSSTKKTANAYATSTGDVALSQTLIEELSRREVEAILAHELTHLQRSHPTRIAVAWIMATAALVFLWWRFPAWANYAWLGWLLAVGLVSRGMEREADAGALRAVADPEAFISAQEKIAALNNMPIRMSRFVEAFTSHPSTERRISTARQSMGAASGNQEDEARFVVPPGDNGEIFSDDANAELATEALLRYPLLATAAAVAAGFLVEAYGVELADAIPIYAATAGLIIALGLLNPVAMPSSRRNQMIDRLRQKLKSEGWPVDGPDSFLAGFSPNAQRMLYGASDFWDTGYVFLSGDSIFFVGERARCRVTRNQVLSLDLEEGSELPGDDVDAVIHWRDDGHSRSGSFRLSPVATPLTATGRRWRGIQVVQEFGKVDGRALMPPASNLLGSPSEYETQGVPAGASGIAFGLVMALLIDSVCAASVAFGLTSLSFGGPFASAIGWHVVALAPLGRLAALLTVELTANRPAARQTAIDPVSDESV